MTAKQSEQEWADRLEASREDEALLALAARLTREGEETRTAPSLAFQRQLRRELLNQYEHVPQSARQALWSRATSAAALVLILAVVGLTWLSISSSGRPSFGGQAAPAATQLAQPPEPEGAALPGDNPRPQDVAQLVSANVNAPGGLFPGVAVEVVSRWRLPDGLSAGPAYAHMRDAAGQVVLQADAPLSPEGGIWLAQLMLVLPEDLPPGQYTVALGLRDLSGAALPIYDNGLTNEVALEPVTIAAQAAEAPRLTTLGVSPAAGVALSGTEPITFEVRLAYVGITPPALLDVKLAKAQEDGGWGVAATQLTLYRATGEVTVPVTLYPTQELVTTSDLVLWLELRDTADAAPLFSEIPEGYHWRYTP